MVSGNGFQTVHYFYDNTFDHVELYMILAVSEHYHFPWTNGEPRE